MAAELNWPALLECGIVAPKFPGVNWYCPWPRLLLVCRADMFPEIDSPKVLPSMEPRELPVAAAGPARPLSRLVDARRRPSTAQIQYSSRLKSDKSFSFPRAGKSRSGSPSPDARKETLLKKKLDQLRTMILKINLCKI